jgi:hypothetical protein
MADFTKPVVSSTYVEVLSLLQSKAVDQATMFDMSIVSPSQLPSGTKRWNGNKFEKLTDGVWADLSDEYEINVTHLGNKGAADYVDVSNSQTISGAKTFSGAFTATNAATFNGAVTLGDAITDTVTISGLVQATTFGGDVTIGTTTSPASLTCNNAVVMKDTLDVDSSLTKLHSLEVTNAATFNGAVTLGDAITDDITLNGKLHGLSNLITFADDLKLNEDLTVDKLLTVTGAATFNGGVTLGDAAADIITITGTATFGETIKCNKLDLLDTDGDDVIKLGSSKADGTGTCGITFASNYDSTDKGTIVWHDNNATYAIWGANIENNGALVISALNNPQGDATNSYSDVVVLKSAAGVITDSEHIFLGDIRATNTGSTSYFDGSVQIGSYTHATDHPTSTPSVFSNTGELTINSAVNATSLADTLVALDVKGGVTIAKNLYVGGTLYESSAKELKRNIKPIVGALGKVLKLEGVSYEKKSTGKQEIGLIADDVLGIIPEVVSSKDGKAEALHYTRLTAVLVEAVKELTQKVESLEVQLQRS